MANLYEQVSLSDGLDGILQNACADGTDTRNYGGTRGIQEARELGALIMGVPVEHAIAAGNSSLSIMHLVLRTAMDLGLWGDERRWSDNASETNRPKLLAPVPATIGTRFNQAFRYRPHTHSDDSRRA